MHSQYPDWLQRAVPSASTCSTKLSELRRVEGHYGDLDALYDQDELTGLIDELTYTAEMARTGVENPSRLEINGDLRNNLASYKSAVAKYARFRADVESEAARPALAATDADSAFGAPAAHSPPDLAFRYEADLQAALIACLGQLEPGVSLAPNGKEYNVPSGRIDALAHDANGGHIVIELKAVTAKREVLGQIAAYMADIEDETGTRPRGILIAPDFDAKLISGARMIRGLTLKRYAFSFSFSDIKPSSTGET